MESVAGGQKFAGFSSPAGAIWNGETTLKVQSVTAWNGYSYQNQKDVAVWGETGAT